jgi:hypothetical protein
MSRPIFRNAVVTAGLLACFALPAAAQSHIVDELTQFREPATVMAEAIAKLPDGRIFGFYRGGFKGGIYQSVPDGSGGYVMQIAYEFTASDPGLPGSFRINVTSTEAVEVGADGRIYFAANDGIARFDPDAVTVERVHAFSTMYPVTLTMGIDGATVFGGGSHGDLFSYNTLSGEYRDIGNAGDFFVTAVQMKDGNLLAMNYEISAARVVYRKIDPATGVELAHVIHDRASALPPVRGDDGEVYAMSNIFGDHSIFRVDPGCLCFNSLKTWYYPNSPRIASMTGSRDGSIYFAADGWVQRLNTTVTPPVVEGLFARGLFYFQMAGDGTLLMFDGAGAHGLNTATVVPGTDTSYVVAQQVGFDGVDGLPYEMTEAADGMFYGIAGHTYTRYASIFQIDPVAHTHSLVQRLDLGITPLQYGYGAYTTKLIPGPGGKLYGSFTSYDTSDGAIFSYDPATNTTAIVKALPADPIFVGYPGPEGGFPMGLTFGSDGWMYGVLSYGGDINTGDGALFKLDPESGTLIRLPRPAEPGFYPLSPMVEAAPGVWFGIYGDWSGYCSRVFRLDTDTATFTTVKSFDYDLDGCPGYLAAAPGGTVFVSGHYGGPGGGGAIYSFDVATNASALLKTFSETSGTSSPTDLWIGADGEVYGQMYYWNGIPKPALFRFDRTTNEPVLLAHMTTPSNGFSGSINPGPDGRFYAITYRPASAIAIGIIESVPVAPASGPYGGTTTVSATLKAMGVPIAGETIAFMLNGHAIGSAVTGANGVATLNNVSISGIAIGTHAGAITASFAGNEKFPVASGSGPLTVIDVPTPGLMVGNGFIREGDEKFEFGFIVHERANGTDRGGFVVTVSPVGKKHKPSTDRFVARSFTNVLFSDDPTIRPGRRNRPQVDTVLFAGHGEWNGQAGYTFEAFAQDRGEPGRKRQESLRVTIYDGAGVVVATFEGPLDGGNVQSLRLKR